MAVRFLRLEPSRGELIDPTAAFHQRWKEYTAEFGDQSEIVVVLQGDDLDAVSTASTQLESALRASALVNDVLGTVDWKSVRSRSLQYLSKQQLQSIERTVESGIVPAATGGAGIAPMAGQLAGQLQNAADDGDPFAWENGLRDADQFASGLTNFFAGDLDAPVWSLPLDDRTFPQPGMFQGGQLRVISCFPAASGGLDGAADAVRFVRSVAEEVAEAHANVRIGITGVPVLEFDEMDRSSRDMAFASTISAAGVALLLYFGFRGSRIPIVALIVLAVSMAWSIGWASISIGRLNILSVSFAAILIGLGVDFALHWLAHFEDAQVSPELDDQTRFQARCRITAARCGTGIATAAVTTSSAFFVAGITPFRGLAELGVIAAGGVVLCAVGALVLTPAIVAMSRRSTRPTRTPRYAEYLANGATHFGRRWLLLSLSLIAVTATLAIDFKERGSRVHYDANLLSMQPSNLPSVIVQAQLEGGTPGGLLFAVSRTQSAAEASTLGRSFEQLASVGAVMSLGDLLPDQVDASEKIRVIQRIEDQLGQVRLARFAPSDVSDAIAGIDQLVDVLELSASTLAVGVVDELSEIRQRLTALPGEQGDAIVNGFAEWISGQATAVVRQLRAVAGSDPITVAALPTELTRRFVGTRGTWLVLSFPRQPIWEAEPLEEFVSAVRSVDPEATGTPIQNYEATRQIRQSYFEASVYAMTAVFLLLFLDASTPLNLVLVLVAGAGITGFASWSGLGAFWEGSLAGWCLVFTTGAAVAGVVFDIRGAARAFGAAMPSLFGMVITVGLLALLGIDFNPANLIVLPLILGIGVDDGVHILHGLRSGAGRVPAATIHALTMTSLTSAIGFGSLMISDHRGLASLGVTLVIGVSACYIVSIFTLLPAAHLLTRRRWQQDDATTDSDEVDSDADHQTPRQWNQLAI